MPSIPQSQAQLNTLFNEELEFLELSADSFDNGFKAEAKRMAVTARVLLHDTKNSTSLLTLLNKKTIDFVDSAKPYDDKFEFAHAGLVLQHIGKDKVTTIPSLDCELTTRIIKFDDWWNGVVLTDDNKNEFSRKDIVTTLANKDGGAHVDPTLDKKYVDLKEGESIGWRISDNVVGKDAPLTDQVTVSMRQITHELLKTLKPSYTCKQKTPGGGSVIFESQMIIGSSSTMPKQTDKNLTKKRPQVGSTKVGRNDPCACGSGKKYKKCCI